MPSDGSEVWQDVIPGNLVPLCLCHLNVKVFGNVAAVLLAPVHHIGLVEDVQLPVGDHLLQVVGQQLAPDVQPTHSAAHPLALDIGGAVGETEAGINNQAATLVWQLFPVLKGVEN